MEGRGGKGRENEGLIKCFLAQLHLGLATIPGSSHSWVAHSYGSFPPLYYPPLWLSHPSRLGHACCSPTPLAGDTVPSASSGWLPPLGFLTIVMEQTMVSRGNQAGWPPWAPELASWYGHLLVTIISSVSPHIPGPWLDARKESLPAW